MSKVYLNQNVHEATQERLKIVFEEFDNIYVSFSGGKDSGVLLNLCIDYIKRNNINKKIGVFFMDFEAQYEKTIEYVERMYENNKEYIIPYWVCLPMASRSSVGFEPYWYPWEPSQKHMWARQLPDLDYVVTLENNPLDFYKLRMSQEDLYKEFTPWFHKNHNKEIKDRKTICLVGIRTSESLNRFRAIAGDKGKYKDYIWTTKMAKNIYNGYLLYDWEVQDIWIANGKFDFDYNKMYDLFHQAGLSIHEMRIASPYGEAQMHSLNMYRVLEPKTWEKVVARVSGANFGNIYGGTKAVGYKNISLPEGHTWKSYCAFLLNTLPKNLRENYEQKFKTSIDFWRTKGGVLSNETIQELFDMGIKIGIQGKSNYKTDKEKVTFEEYPDDADVKDFASVPSYKRMCVCIIKNDYLCKYMGFSQTKEQVEKQKRIMEKYKNL